MSYPQMTQMTQMAPCVWECVRADGDYGQMPAAQGIS